MNGATVPPTGSTTSRLATTRGHSRADGDDFIWPGDWVARLAPIVDPAPGRLAIWAGMAAVAFDVGLRGSLANGATFAGIVAIVVLLVSDGRLPRRGARRLALSALVPGAFLVIRASPWLVAANIGAVSTLVAVAALLPPPATSSSTTSGERSTGPRSMRRTSARCRPMPYRRSPAFSGSRTDPAIARRLLYAVDCGEREEATGISAANLAEMLAASPWQRLCAGQ